MKTKMIKASVLAFLLASVIIGANTSCSIFGYKAVPDSVKAIVDSIAGNMVLVEGGTFTMGNNDYKYDYQKIQSPAHQVTLDSFYICKYEVTQREWKAVMGENPSDYQEEGDKNPVESVSWLMCQEFVKRLNEITGKNYRLPTEAEWEFAARGGNKSRGTIYAGSDDPEKVGCIYTSPFGELTQAVGLLAPNELGLFDMSGNVNELCLDIYDDYGKDPQVNPIGKGGETSVYRVARGGGWCNARRNCTVTTRLKVEKDLCANAVGLRLAMDAK